MGLSLLNPLEDQGSLAVEKVKRPGESGIVMLPWEAPGLTAEVRSRMRSISQESSTFLAPPQLDDPSFSFDMATSVGVVMEALSVDKHLEKHRHLLVPQQVTEEAFFRNYFAHLHALAHGSAPTSESSDAASSAVVVNQTPSSDGTEVAAASHTPLEEQFDCLSEELFANAVASRLTGPSEGSAESTEQRCGDGDLSRASPASSPVAETLSEDALSSSWEAELRAEIDGLDTGASAK